MKLVYLIPLSELSVQIKMASIFFAGISWSIINLYGSNDDKLVKAMPSRT